MAWIIEWDNKAEKELKRLSKPVQGQILKYLRERIKDDPRSLGKGLSYGKLGLWRYRVNDYRIVCKIKDNKLIILVLSVGHRKEIYK